ncbi:MAG TPA: iron-containing redox enzyme family protein [Parasulfuritortus sp.]
MPFYDRLIAATATERAGLQAVPIIRRALAGDVSRDEYLAFLGQAYHHVKHTVPLLMACGARLPERLGWLREAVARYIEEEIGHEEWILDDIAAAGGDPDAVRQSRPLPATELMVAYAYHTIDRGNPAGFFGMVHVLEGTSVALAHQAAGAIQQRLQLPADAFRYLTSHGSVDQDHIRFLEDLLNRLDDTEAQAAVTHSAGMFFGLYGDIFRSINP